MNDSKKRPVNQANDNVALGTPNVPTDSQSTDKKTLILTDVKNGVMKAVNAITEADGKEASIALIRLNAYRELGRVLIEAEKMLKPWKVKMSEIIKLMNIPRSTYDRTMRFMNNAKKIEKALSVSEADAIIAGKKADGKNADGKTDGKKADGKNERRTKDADELHGEIMKLLIRIGKLDGNNGIKESIDKINKKYESIMTADKPKESKPKADKPKAGKPDTIPNVQKVA